jgi:PAS domain S-box-containing protein
MSEKKFRELFENIGDGYYCTTPAGELREANPAFVRMLGYDSLEELKAVSVQDCYFAPEDRKCAYVDKHNTEFSGQWEIYRLKKKDGEEVWVEDMARYVLDENGKVVFHQGICRDITERKKAEKLLLQKERDKAILELLNDLSQPLMIMSGASSNMMASLIEGNISDKDIKSFAKAFERFSSLRKELLFRTVTT